MSVQYQTECEWDTDLFDLELTDINNPVAKGLVQTACKKTAGTPAIVAGKYMVGAIVQNAASGVVYRNSGTTAIPAWTAM